MQAMAKKAVLIGCNYPGTKAELRGCINDVWRMHNCLINRFGFSEEDITVLIDTDHSYTQPTGKNIRTALSRLVQSAEPGDVLFVHYSGHGTRLPAEAEDQEDDDTGYDECIVPADMNLITDDDFRKFVDKVPSDCRITIVSDSCHSGGLIQATKEQIGNSTKEGGQISGNTFGFNFLHRTVQEKDIIESCGFHNYMKNRSLPLATLIDLLKEKTGKDDIDVGKIRPTLFTVFKQDATPKVKKFMKHTFDKLKRGGNEDRGLGGILGFVGDFANEYLSQMMDDLYDDEETCTKPCKQEAYDGCGILLSGCQTDQTSADASPPGDPKEAYGAFSNAIQAIIKETDGVVTNGELVLMARRKLRWQGYTQKPGLYCSDQHVDAPFLG